MAFYRWPAPDDVRCEKPCAHTDCAEWRVSLQKPCVICGELFKAGDAVQRPDDGEAHMLCVVKRYEDVKLAKARGLPHEKRPLLLSILFSIQTSTETGLASCS